jgi:hypothetical protein
VRTRSGKDLGSMSIDEFAKGLQAELVSRGRIILED